MTVGSHRTPAAGRRLRELTASWLGPVQKGPSQSLTGLCAEVCRAVLRCGWCGWCRVYLGAWWCGVVHSVHHTTPPGHLCTPLHHRTHPAPQARHGTPQAAARGGFRPNCRSRQVKKSAGINESSLIPSLFITFGETAVRTPTLNSQSIRDLRKQACRPVFVREHQ